MLSIYMPFKCRNIYISFVIKVVNNISEYPAYLHCAIDSKSFMAVTGIGAVCLDLNRCYFGMQFDTVLSDPSFGRHLCMFGVNFTFSSSFQLYTQPAISTKLAKKCPCKQDSNLIKERVMSLTRGGNGRNRVGCFYGLLQNCPKISKAT